jgi:hypothetical protein
MVFITAGQFIKIIHVHERTRSSLFNDNVVSLRSGDDELLKFASIDLSLVFINRRFLVLPTS